MIEWPCEPVVMKSRQRAVVMIQTLKIVRVYERHLILTSKASVGCGYLCMRVSRRHV